VRDVTAAIAADTPISAWSMETLNRFLVKPIAAVRMVISVIPTRWSFFLLIRGNSFSYGIER
jgi:hypothetical protein